MMPVRLAALISHPIQYFAPLYRELACRPEIAQPGGSALPGTPGAERRRTRTRDGARAVQWPGTCPRQSRAHSCAGARAGGFDQHQLGQQQRRLTQRVKRYGVTKRQC